MYATVLRPCTRRALFLLSIFEAPATGSLVAFKDAIVLTREEIDALLDADPAPSVGHGMTLFASALRALEDRRHPGFGAAGASRRLRTNAMWFFST
ncbi:MAG TPA: hypothetical protein VFP36_05585 [Usitatibacter sp.]|nr:hypothetical protein [Usitatibacter sp.]